MTDRQPLVKSRQRVTDHGEVFTPNWLVESMLDLVKDESERIDSRILEPACGSGNFLVEVLKRKLHTVEIRYGKSQFERDQYALLGLMCIYGIELLPDNLQECRENMLATFDKVLEISEASDLHRAAANVLRLNIIHGDALTMLASDGSPITFPEWGYLGRGKFQRRDFLFRSLTQMSAFSEEGTLFADVGKHEIFTPIKSYPTLTLKELAV